MIRGMTAYAGLDKKIGHWSFLVEMWSYNHKFLKIDFSVPHEIKKYFHELENIISSDVKRGKVNIKISFLPEAKEKEVIFNKSLAETIYKLSLEQKKKGEKSLEMKDIFNFSGVIETIDIIPDFDKLWPDIERLIKRTLKELVKVKKEQGENTGEDLKNTMDVIAKALENIKKVHKKENSDFAKKMKEKLKNFDINIDDGSVREEALNFIRNCDINEEIIRISGYLRLLKSAVRSKAAVGRKIDFIAQELLREANTIGSKKDNFEIKKDVVKIKEQIEKIREQAQNIE